MSPHLLTLYRNPLSKTVCCVWKNWNPKIRRKRCFFLSISHKSAKKSKPKSTNQKFAANQSHHDYSQIKRNATCYGTKTTEQWTDFTKPWNSKNQHVNCITPGNESAPFKVQFYPWTYRIICRLNERAGATAILNVHVCLCLWL